MARIKKQDVVIPAEVASEVLDVPELGGEVEVRGLLLGERIEATTQGRYRLIPSMLAACVRDAEGEQLMTSEEWDRWGSEKKNADAALTIFWVARRLCGMEVESVEKKS